MTELDFACEHQTSRDSERSSESLEARWRETWRAERSFAAPEQHDDRVPAYVFIDCALAVGEHELSQIRGCTIADACARFLRARGRAVLFSLGFDAFGQIAEDESLRSAVAPHEWAQGCYRQTLSRLEALGCSCDWERAFLSSAPELYRWSQWLFLTLLERGQVYPRGIDWLMRIEPPPDDDERSPALAGWDEAAIALQREAIGRVEGVELQAGTFASGGLTVFTPHAQAIADTRFVAISPAHPEIDRFTTDPTIAERVAALGELDPHCEGGRAEVVPVVVIEELATVPSVAGMLPIVISPLVDARFGATAVLGVPELDPIDRAIAECLPPSTGTTWKVSASRTAIQPAVRYRAHDVVISSPRAWGPPIPVIDCPRCGKVPVPVDDLPVRLPDDLKPADGSGTSLAERSDFQQCACSACGGAAARETATIDCLTAMWMWMPICVPPERRLSAMMSDREYERWLPVQQVVSNLASGAGMLERRVLAGILQGIAELPPLPGRDLFSRVLLHGDVRIQADAPGEHADRMADVDALLTQAGSDAVRLTMLHAASPGRTFSWNDERLRYCQRFLQRLYRYARPRLHEWSQHSDRNPDPADIDASDQLRRRLAHWCAVACEKLTAQLETLQLQRAVHNTIRLATRIEDFESRALEQRGELDELDQQAIVAALLVLVRLMAPLAPFIAEELWSCTASAARVSDAGWPTYSRPRRSPSEPLPSTPRP